MTDFAAAIIAVHKLNPWARSLACRRTMSSPKRAIYHLKREAIKELSRRGLLGVRRIEIKTKCRDCGGTGRYYDSYGQTHDHCYKCGNSGKVKLEFVETTIRNGPLFGGEWEIEGITWHTPYLQWPGMYAGCKSVTDMPTETSDWQPNKPGMEMPVHVVARLLMDAESFFTDRPGKQRWHYDFGSGEYDIFQYRLYLGETDKSICSLCGGDAREGGYGVCRGRIEWTDHACKVCENIHGVPGKATIFDAFPIPKELLTHPDVRMWVETHPKDKP